MRKAKNHYISFSKAISTYFGRKKGILYHASAIFRSRFGLFNRYKYIDYSRVKRIVFICKGNICRSPFAEFKAKQYNVETASAGISVNAPDPAHEWGCQTAPTYNVDLTKHRSKSIYDIEVRQSDLLVAFEPWQAAWLTNFAAEKGCQVTLLGLHLKKEIPHIVDPYGLSVEYFQTCYSRIAQGIEALIEKISSKVSRTVLVTEAESTGAVAVIRSLGRAGHQVVAMSVHDDAIGFKSNFVLKSLVSPDYSSPGFIQWLRRILGDYRVEVIIPSESFLLAIKDSFGEFKSLIPFSPEREVVYKGLSKCDLFSVIEDRHLPLHIIVDLNNYSFVKIADKVQRMKFPVFVKTDAIYAKATGGGLVRKAANMESLEEILEELALNYKKCLIQEYTHGCGVGAFFIIWDGEIVADFMHLRLHEVPYSGGVSSLRRSYYHQEIYEDAVEKCLHMRWKGPVMIEYRHDTDRDTFSLMEMNGRFWGSLHLPLYAGVDFPKILVELHFGVAPHTPVPYWRNRKTVSRQTFPLEIQHVWSILKSDELPGLVKIKSILVFFLDTINPAIKSDFFSFKGDRLLFYYSFWYMVRNIINKRRR